MLETVHADLIFLAKPGSILRQGKVYEATANKNGAICGVCEDGDILGVKPGEFEFVDAPDWVQDIWRSVHPSALASLDADCETSQTEETTK